MIVLYSDFGLAGPYTGQVKAALWREAPGVPVIDLFADAPSQRPLESAYLLAAYAGADVFPMGSVFLCVVDPGVGSDRPAVALLVDGRWFVGPGNGLFELVQRRGRSVESYHILPADGAVSPSFHGRDLFAPVAGRLAVGKAPELAGMRLGSVPRFADWPDDLPAIVYIDGYGNLLTGLRASFLPPNATVRLAEKDRPRARTFSDVPVGHPFWYENANGLVEIAVNRGRADRLFSLGIGAPVEVIPTDCPPAW
ncbi:SAM-dependent chlorinase/fluorinase [Telmatospirillum sp.]|uniref:SAM hydrolase/SAM-dependent halogenase family protein n=1 Tax=Telmatospirillum sp. TaxID=2079197 RepID=UPI0028411770|nr:SAM-dependent chlorinase/fluorinase [Telmatospirillum sp.]MDR3439314.1 SAM-dependent chlorinase/fluorinase [Telmatospirillum sp.]